MRLGDHVRRHLDEQQGGGRAILECRHAGLLLQVSHLSPARRDLVDTSAQGLSVDLAGVKLIELVARSAATANEKLPVSWGQAALLLPVQSD